MSKSDPPRIHTLRTDGVVPRTSDCFTPRTLEGNDGAFKTAKYGSSIEGPYRSSNKYAAPIMWILAVVMVIATLVLVKIS
jgi:hypothetical protein